MDIVLIFILGLALSMDTLTVSLIISLTTKKLHVQEYKLPILFGLAHAGMIIIGYRLSTEFMNIIEQFDHWIAFALLLILGIKMIVETSKKQEPIKWNNWKNTTIITIATSIDALALGITFKILEQNLIASSAIIGLIVIITSYIGLLFGKKLKFLKPKYNGLLGGMILIVIGIKIVVEHLL